MRFMKVENGIPKRENFKLMNYFNEFIAMNTQIAKVELDKDDYKSVYIACSTLKKSAKLHAVPIRVIVRNGELYFIRTDMRWACSF